MGDAFSSLFGASGPPSDCVRVHVRLAASERGTKGLGLHVWGPAAAAATGWDQPLAAGGEDWFGPYFDVALAELPPASGGPGPALGLLLHCGEDKRASLELASVEEVPAGGSELWFGHGAPAAAEAPSPAAVPCGDLGTCGARAHWLTEGRIAWRAAAALPHGTRFWLHASAAGGLADGGAAGVQNGDTDAGPYELTLVKGGLTPALAAASPYLHGCGLLAVPNTAHARLLCRRQLAVCAQGPGGEALDCTGVQLGPVLDELFAYTGPLGCVPSSEAEAPEARPRWGGVRRQRSGVAEAGVSLLLWAPTAQEVSATFYDGPRGPETETVPMERGAESVWRLAGPEEAARWGRYYTYRVKAFHPQVGKVVTMETPDPYSRACSADAGRTLAVHLPTCTEAVPGGDRAAWREKPRPKFQHRGKAVVYELHVRDFSASDPTVPEGLRGKYLAFELEGTRGDAHLRRLASAGLSHVQLLPSYDFGTVPERAEDRCEPAVPAGEEPDSEAQQAAVTAVADKDAYNWGYDPVLFDVPEGSYATDPEGLARVREHRRMVGALHAKGLRVVVDVVYNHTLASGPVGPQSVLDKCVPGYYHRRSEGGAYENSTCMNNTAVERSMMERLVVDSVLHWVLEYRVDGFRFDLMGHLPLRCARRCRAALDALTPEDHGVDGPRVLLYGEGWEFGEVAGGKRGVMAVQQKLAGSGIGSFNDRVRDAAIGGTPFTDPRTQGFATGLWLRPWPAGGGVEQGSPEQQLKSLLVAADKVRIALAASLREFHLAEDCNGRRGVRAAEAHGGGVAYTAAPEEIVNYVSAHDNETLYDNTAWKMPPSLFSPEERMRANWLCTAVIALGHGVPFFHAGDEVLRSKSLDRDSYNSGDWFNALDFSGECSGFGRGLPPKAKNGEKWPLMGPLLRDPALRPTPQMAAATTAKFCELLRLRASTPLLGLTEAADLLAKVDFPGCGHDQVPGLIVMQIRNGQAAAAPESLLCPHLARVVVVFSSRLEETRLPVPQVPVQVQASSRPRWGAARRRPEAGELPAELPGGEAGPLPLRLHPLQAASEDAVTRSARLDAAAGVLIVPPQSAVVFVEPLPGHEGWNGE